MVWQKFTRSDRLEGTEDAFISISPRYIALNAQMVRKANIDAGTRVTIYVDPGELKLAFEFHKEERANSFALMRASADKTGMKRLGLNFSAKALLKKHPWIKSVVDRAPKEPRDRRFTPKKEGTLWTVQFMPSFEERRDRESADIPAEAEGIYRYLTDDGEVVYIGRGRIQERLASPGREDWEFSVVEYSVVKDPDARLRWESYWIERFKAQHRGRLPQYNRQSGDRPT